MKKFLLTLALVLTATVATMQAQRINVSINIGSQPSWGPVGYDYVDYYYLPDIDCYYSVNQGLFFYQNAGRWLGVRYLPYAYRDYDFYSMYKVVLVGHDPWLHHNRHRRIYAHYVGYRSQPIIRYSKDRRYRDSRHNDVVWYDRRGNDRYDNRRYNDRNDNGRYNSRDDRRYDNRRSSNDRYSNNDRQDGRSRYDNSRNDRRYDNSSNAVRVDNGRRPDNNRYDNIDNNRYNGRSSDNRRSPEYRDNSRNNERSLNSRGNNNRSESKSDSYYTQISSRSDNRPARESNSRTVSSSDNGRRSSSSRR